jgi:hypothetical protein
MTDNAGSTLPSDASDDAVFDQYRDDRLTRCQLTKAPQRTRVNVNVVFDE